MKLLQIVHETEYRYHYPVNFGPHRIMVRPREGHDVHIVRSRIELSPEGSLHWLRDTYGNSIAVFESALAADALRIVSEVVVAHYDDNPFDFVIDPEAASYPFQYSMDEHHELIPYRLPCFEHDSAVLRDWLKRFYQPGQLIPTFALLEKLNEGIHREFKYEHREEPGVQSPARTLEKKSGSCRDFATLYMEAARQWGIGARFVTGYVHVRNEQHGATHAWAEVYLPGAGWRGFDPTNNNMAGSGHVSVAVARDPVKASPISGTWNGPCDAFRELKVDVVVKVLPDTAL